MPRVRWHFKYLHSKFSSSLRFIPHGNFQLFPSFPPVEVVVIVKSLSSLYPRETAVFMLGTSMSHFPHIVQTASAHQSSAVPPLPTQHSPNPNPQGPAHLSDSTHPAWHHQVLTVGVLSSFPASLQRRSCCAPHEEAPHERSCGG